MFVCAVSKFIESIAWNAYHIIACRRHDEEEEEVKVVGKVKVAVIYNNIIPTPYNQLIITI